MSLTRPDLDALLDAMAPIAGLTIEAPSRPRIVDSLEMAAAAAQLIMDFELDEATDEPAPTFHPGLFHAGADK